jgi:hypothetical protein
MMFCKLPNKIIIFKKYLQFKEAIVFYLLQIDCNDNYSGCPTSFNMAYHLNNCKLSLSYCNYLCVEPISWALEFSDALRATITMNLKLRKKTKNLPFVNTMMKMILALLHNYCYLH